MTSIMSRPRLGGVRAFLTSGPMAARGFPWLLTGQFTSNVGDQCYAIAVPWLILSSGGGPSRLGVVLACYGISRTAALPAGGALADRFGSRAVMMVTDAVRFGLVLVLAAACVTVTPGFIVLALVSAGLGACGGVFVPASFALLPGALPEKDLSAGYSMSSAATQLGGLLGPVIGGVLVATVGPPTALFVDAASYLVSSGALLALRIPKAAPREKDPDGNEVTFRSVLLRGRFLQVVLVAALIGNFVYAGTADVALPTLAHHDFGAGGYGILLSGLGAGMIVGTLSARWKPQRLAPSSVIVILALIMGAAVAAVPFAGGLAGATVCITVFAAANGWSGTIIMTTLQLWAPRHVLARVMSVMLMAMLGTFPLSVAVTGWAVARFGATPSFLIAGAAMAIAILWAATRPAFRNYRPSDQFASEAEQAPAVSAEEAR